MKKIFLTLLLAVLLCGCQKSNPEYLISSIGFDSQDGELGATFEAVIINSEKNEQTRKLITAKGETVGEMLESARSQCPQAINISHCGVLIIGQTVNENQLQGIYDFCFEDNDITISTFFVKTENAQKLLLAEPVSSVCVGYDIMGILEQYKTQQKAKLNNRYFEIAARDFEVSLPQIALKDGGYYFEKY